MTPFFNHKNLGIQQCFFLLRSVKACQNTNKVKMHTPWKINMEPTNQPFRKENDQNQTSMIRFQPLIFQGVRNRYIARVPQDDFSGVKTPILEYTCPKLASIASKVGVQWRFSSRLGKHTSQPYGIDMIKFMGIQTNARIVRVHTVIPFWITRLNGTLYLKKIVENYWETHRHF